MTQPKHLLLAWLASSLLGCPTEPAQAPAQVATPVTAAPVPPPTPPTTPVPAPAANEIAAEPGDPPLADAATAEPTTTETAATTPPTAPSAPIDVYSGTHKLGVNRVTDMARVGSATFSRRDGALYLEGRVKRGVHWLHLSGKVEPRGNDKFMLTGVLEGIPDMRWNGEAPRERRTEGSFLFEVNKRRPYWRLYQVNGRDCVCWDNCGNDFCYIDIETKPQP